ncbi:MAG: OmpH family outer membrane protein [Verrucomicrobiota bacterium]
MKNSLKSLVALVAFGAATLAASAQPAVKILVVDMAKLYDNHYKTLEQNAKIQADDQKAQEEVDKMNKEGNALVEEYKSLNDQSSNPALSNDAKTKAQGDAQKKLEQIQGKQNEVRTFIQNTRNSLQQRLQTFRSLMLEEISKTAADVAKRKGGTLLMDKAGPSLIGVSNIVYSDPGYEITDDVMTEINKTRPAGAPTNAAEANAKAGLAVPPAGAPAGKAAPAPAAGPAAPGVTVPGLAPKK